MGEQLGGDSVATKSEKKQLVYPLLPLRGLLVFPTMVLHFDVGREKSIKALEKCAMTSNQLLLSSQEDGQVDDPTEEDLFHIGTLAKVKQMMKLPNGTIRVLVEGIARARIHRFTKTDEWFEVEVAVQEEQDFSKSNAEYQALMRSVLQQFEQYLKLSKKVDQEAYSSVVDISDPSHFADAVAAHLPLKIREKQQLLEELDVMKRLEKLLQILSDEREILELERNIHQRVRKQMERTQKEYYLREQMKAIQKELGDRDSRSAEVEELRQQLEQKEMPLLVKEKVEKELERLERIPQASAEGTVVRTYLDWLLALPWIETAQQRVDLRRAEKVLNEEHYGLEKIKERILEFLAVQRLSGKMTGPIICLAGPPGVGKTSLARSIATALKRPFVRASLGGVRDEAEIRGHRRTYIGAMPGRIIQGMKSAGVKNPVFLLDEIDKMANDFRGDPSSALLEVLDPEQNQTFSDHYIEIPFDLSDVMFITTANNVYQIPGPLRDRMEIIQLSGYTELEKLNIVKQHLLPRQKEKHALKADQMRISEDVLLMLIRHYTREAGVRQLERVVAAVCRKVARRIASGEKKRITVQAKTIEDFLGPPIYRYGAQEEEDQIGVVNGLAWTETGGDLLSVEVSVVPGKGKLVLTGHLGDVMRESAQTAFSYVRSRAGQFGLQHDFYENVDLHVHVPEGAIPKDGPSAGITMATCLISALTGRRVRRDVAMTGEITLRGRVLPIGGLREKSLAAHRAGIRHVIHPLDNVKDLRDIPQVVRDEMEFHAVKHMDEVVALAFVEPFPLEEFEGFYPTDKMPDILRNTFSGEGAHQ